MFFLLRMAFWFTLALVLLPTGNPQPADKKPTIGAADAVVAASAAVSDMSSFCDRQPGACAVGSQAVQVIGQRAQAGARMVYEFIHEQMANSETGSVPAAKVMPAAASRTVPTFPGSQTTLRPEDLTPAWQGPPPRREARPRREQRPRA